MYCRYTMQSVGKLPSSQSQTQHLLEHHICFLADVLICLMRVIGVFLQLIVVMF